MSLLDGLKAGDEAAFEQLFHRYYPALCVYAKRLLGDADEAKEVVQDTFVRLYERRQDVTPVTSLKSYLYRTVHNACLNHLKQAKVHQGHHFQLQRQGPSAEEGDVLELLELQEQIWQVVQRLPEQCRKIFQMSRFEQVKNPQIAQQLGLSVRTVETQISKALKILRRELADYLPLLLMAAGTLP